MRLKNTVLTIVDLLGAHAAVAQNQAFSFYGGIQESPHSTVNHGVNSFGAGSRAPIAITILVKNPATAQEQP